MLVAVDSETHLITPTCKAPPVVCITWQDEDCTGRIAKAGADTGDMVRRWLEEDILVFHNAPFDLGVFAAKWPNLLPLIFKALDEGRIKDTMIRQKLSDIAAGCFRGQYKDDGSFERYTYHLADLARRHLDIYVNKGEDTWRLRYKELEDVPLADWPPDAAHYAINDACLTGDVFVTQSQVENAAAFLADEDRQMRAAWWLHLAGCWGMLLDPAKVRQLEKGIRDAFEECQTLLIEEGLVRVETYKVGAKKGQVRKISKDTKAAKARMLAVCEETGMEVRKTAKDGVCLNEEACEDSGDPLLQSYAEYSALGNVLSKDVKNMVKDFEIHGNFDSLVASGRTSCRSGGKGLGGMNLQNLRRKGTTRECFIPRPGFVYCLIDLDTAELRAVSQVCINLLGHSRLANVINEGKDAHCLLTAEALGIPYDEVIRRVAEDDQEMADERQLHKHANFGLWGGMRERRFRALIKKMTGRLVTEEKVIQIREAWLATWPEAGEYLELHENLCRLEGTTTVTQEYSGRIRGGVRYSEAANTRFQGLIADAAKAAGYALSKEMYVGDGVLRGSRIVNFPHDEFICEVPEDIGHECAMDIRRIVLEEVGKWLPDVPPKATPYLARYWSKNGFPITVDGRLVPWNGEKKEKRKAA